MLTRRLFAVLALLVLAPTVSAQAPSLAALSDAVPGRHFSAAGSAVDPDDDTTLQLGLESFTASTIAYIGPIATGHRQVASDTVSVRIQAPPGFYVSGVAYEQDSSGTIARTGKAHGASTWVVAGVAQDLGVFGTAPTRVTGAIDLTGQYLTDVPLSVSTTLMAFATPTSGAATITVTRAVVRVTLAERP